MNEHDKKRASVVRTASWVGIIGNAFLAVLKIFVGLVFKSLAILGDGIDSATDIITSVISLFAARIMNKPPDADHPYGHGRIETLAAKIISFIIFFAGIQLATTSIRSLVTGSYQEISIVTVVVAGVSILGKILLAAYKFRAGRKINSPLLIADAKNMRNDVVISSAVLTGLLIGKLTGIGWFDAATALIISGWIMYVGFSIFRESDVELMEGHDNLKDYRMLFEAVERVPGAYNPHKVRIRKIGNMLIIDLDIEVNENLSVREGHDIAVKVENAVKKNVGNVYDVQVHVEPLGNEECDERYGVTPQELEQHL